MRLLLPVLIVAFLAPAVDATSPQKAQAQQVQLDLVIARIQQGKGKDGLVQFLRHSNRGDGFQPAPDQGNIYAGVLPPDSGILGFLKALSAVGVGKVVAEPRLLTLDGQQASFHDGGQFPVPVASGREVGVQFEDFGLRVSMLPTVLPRGQIHLEVEPEISKMLPESSSGTAVPSRSTQRIHTSVELASGQTFLLGGFIEKEAGKEADTELLILVTPHVEPQAEVIRQVSSQEKASEPDGASTRKKDQPAELMKLWEAYTRACAEGRPEVARALALRMLELDPLCFSQIHRGPAQPAPSSAAAPLRAGS
jgi:Flp pilus assembly secretin CpaC